MEETNNVRRSVRILERNIRQQGEEERRSLRRSSDDSCVEDTEDFDLEEEKQEAEEDLNLTQLSAAQQFIPKKPTQDEVNNIFVSSFSKVNESLLEAHEKIDSIQKSFVENLKNTRELLQLPEKMADVNNSLEYLWQTLGKTSERIETSERYTKELGAHLEEWLMDTTR